MNGATGVSDMAGYAVKVAVERCGKQPRYNGATGVSDMAGKAATVAVERCGKQPRYK
jgi:hypothetical protein